MEKPITILVIDDEQSIRWVLEKTLNQPNYNLILVESATQALEVCQREEVEIALVDINLPDASGLDLLHKMLQQHPTLLGIVITGQSTMYNTITAMKVGAYDYLAKPFDIDEVEALVARAAKAVISARNAVRPTEKKAKPVTDLLVGNSRMMREIYKGIGRVSATDLTVLILGESGTGKELIARSIHMHSNRSEKPFIAINCAAIPSELLESELFGHEKGAFTGANERKKGKLELANGGTLFLDEIGDMPLNLQGKLLRVLQERQFERVGGHENIRADIRVVSATHQHLEALIEKGLFRSDLFYRLNVFPIFIPPLRERREDIPLLLEHFLRKTEKELGIYPKTITPEAVNRLSRYNWPGNVREMENIIKSLMITTVAETVTHEALPRNITQHEPSLESDVSLEDMIYRKIKPFVTEYVHQGGDALMPIILEQVERPLLRLVLELTRWNQNRTAKILGINRNTLRKKIELLALKKSTG